MDQGNTESTENTQTGGFDTGEFETGEFTRSDSGEKTSSRRRHRRRRRRSKNKKLGPMLATIGIGLFCVVLIGVGIVVGLSYSADQGDAERYRQALEARQAAKTEWLSECTTNGYAEWTCARFDQVHFQKAEKLDVFRCNPTAKANVHECEYKLGTAEVVVSLPEAYEVNGEFLAPKERSHALIRHSNVEDSHYISVSETGRIEIRARDPEAPLFVINPASGSLNALHKSVQPDE